ncbi:MAG: type II toxin-antitoxin system Phd/YefM family antitoxin [Deltaproteobacteria bacterium]|nr:type II toxin-antitoxin system Phd/YefM family antitoxin [Deltaproteobacteria bacterium]
MKWRQVNTAQAKNQLNRLLEEIQKSHKPLIIEKRGEPIAAIIDITTYREKLGGEFSGLGDRLLQDLLKFHHSILEEQGVASTGDSVELLQELRRER